MICASTFCAMTRICSSVRLRSVKRASAAVVAIISADDPEMPAPAGDSESVSISSPSLGAKNCSRRAASGRRKRFALRKCVQAREDLFPLRVQRPQVNAFALQRSDPTGGENVDREVQGQRAGMKQIKRPQVNRASGQIGAARRLRNDGSGHGDVQEASMQQFVSRPAIELRYLPVTRLLWYHVDNMLCAARLKQHMREDSARTLHKARFSREAVRSTVDNNQTFVGYSREADFPTAVSLISLITLAVR